MKYAGGRDIHAVLKSFILYKNGERHEGDVHSAQNFRRKVTGTVRSYFYHLMKHLFLLSLNISERIQRGKAHADVGMQLSYLTINSVVNNWAEMF
jgi:hypothetical protein